LEEYKADILRQIRSFLRSQNFLISEENGSGVFAFDIIAKNGDENYLIKITYNIDSLKSDIVIEMKRFACSFNISALVIGVRNGNGILEEGVVYFRHGMPIMSMATFMDYVKGNRPYIYAGPGGFYVPIDGKKMQDARINSGSSIGYVSGRIGLSRRSISLYESGNSTTLEVFEKLVEILKADISRTLDLIEIAREWENIPEEIADDDMFVNLARRMLNQMGIMTETFRKFPFNALGKNDDADLLVMGLFEELSKNASRVPTIKQISDFVEKEPVIIVEEKTDREYLGGCQVISLSEIRESGLSRILQKRERKGVR
jgi:putative transcriptional regulator